MNIIDFVYLFFAALVLYFTFIFILLFTRNKKDFDKVPKIGKLPTVSMLVPAHNEEKTIGAAIENLKRLNYPKGKLEIIVIDDGSTDNTAKIAKRYGVKVISKKQGGKASALNVGVKHCRGSVIACMDADSFPEKDSLLQTVPFIDNDTAAVTTQIFAKKETKALEKFQAIEYAMIAWSRKLFEYVEGVYVTPGPLSLYKKDVVIKVGGFDEKNLTEDIEIAWRLLDAGYKIRMSPGKVYTVIPSTIKKWWKQRLRWNIGGMQTFIKYKKSVFKKEGGSFGYFIVPFFALSYFLSLLALSIFLYLIYAWAFNNIMFYFTAYSVGIDPLKRFTPIIIPDFFVVFGILIFAMSLIVVNSGLKTMNYPRSLRTWVYALLYLTIYITIFPVILVHSLVRMVRGRKEW